MNKISKQITRCPITFTKNAEYNSQDYRFIEVTVDVLHTGVNLNGSYFSKEAVNAAIPSISNTPILGYILYDEDGDPDDFKGHEHEFHIDSDGIKYVYSGSAYGVIPESCNPRWITKDDGYGTEREYLEVDGLLWTKFNAPCEIFERDGEKNHSMEITDIQGVEDTDGLYHVSSFTFDGCCVLSTTDPDIAPAMVGSNIVANFSVDSIAAQIKERLNEFSAVKGNMQCNTQKGDVELMATQTPNNPPIAPNPTTPENNTLPNTPAPAPAVPNEQYSLTQNQLRTEINRLLESYTFKDRWDDINEKYWLNDIQDNEAIVTDCEDGYKLFGIPYSVSNNDVALDFSGIKRKKITYEDWTLQDNSSADANQIELMFQSIADKFCTRIDSMKEISNLYAEIRPKYDSYVAAETKAKSEEVAAKRSKLFEIMDKQLGDDEDYAALKNNTDMEYPELETRCYALYGKKSAEFSYTPHTNKATNVRFGVSGTQITQTTDAYGGLIEHYGVR